MPGALRPFFLKHLLPLLIPLLALVGCSASQPPVAKKAPAPAATALAAPLFTPPPSIDLSTPPAPAKPGAVMLGIDVLEADAFRPLKGKRVGLLTHPAGVNRRGERTIDVLRRAPGVKLVALFGPEHGVNGEFAGGVNYNDYVDKRTGLPVRSLYDGKMYNGRMRTPRKEQLKDLDIFVIDLQDIGTRSYTFISAMKNALEGCFENGVEVMVLDRPNPLGGLKVDGPPLDAALAKNNYVGSFRVPYVYGLTIGELAHMAREAPGVLDISDKARTNARLTVVAMRGWTRSMRWPETGLTWVATSPRVQDFSAVQGYPMTGLGTEPPSGFSSGVGNQHAFRGVSHRTVTADVVEKELRALKLPGLNFQRVSVPNARTGKPATGLYIEITDWDDWHPTELNFWLMELACKLEPRNPYATGHLDTKSLFVKLVGSTAFINDLMTKGKNVDIPAWLKKWHEEAVVYQLASRKYWLYQ